jgi:hypothetical protein
MIGYDVITTPFADGRIFQQIDYVADLAHESIRETISRRVIDTQEEQVRTALIALGWTPPA